MTAIGLIILTTQTLPVLGYYPKEDTELVKTFEKEAENALVIKSIEENSKNDLIDKQSLTEAAMNIENLDEIDIQNESKVQASNTPLVL